MSAGEESGRKARAAVSHELAPDAFRRRRIREAPRGEPAWDTMGAAKTNDAPLFRAYNQGADERQDVLCGDRDEYDTGGGKAEHIDDPTKHAFRSHVCEIGDDKQSPRRGTDISAERIKESKEHDPKDRCDDQNTCPSCDMKPFARGAERDTGGKIIFRKVA